MTPTTPSTSTSSIAIPTPTACRRRGRRSSGWIRRCRATRLADPDADGALHACRVPARQPSRRHAGAVSRRRRRQRLLPDAQIALANPGTVGADRGAAPPGRRRGDVVRDDPRRGPREPGRRRRRAEGVVVLDGHRVRPAAGGRQDHDLGRRLRQPRRDRDGRRRRPRTSSRRARRTAGSRCSICCRTRSRPPAHVTIDVPAPGAGAADHAAVHDTARIAADDRRGRHPGARGDGRLGPDRVERSDPGRAGDVHGHHEPRPGVRRRPRRGGRHERAPAVVPGRGRDRRLLRPLLPDRQPQPAADARAGQLPAARRRDRSCANTTSPPRAASRSRSTARIRACSTRPSPRSSRPLDGGTHRRGAIDVVAGQRPVAGGTPVRGRRCPPAAGGRWQPGTSAPKVRPIRMS